MEFEGLLTILVFLPLLGAVFIALVVTGDRNVRYVAGVVSLIELALSIVVFLRYDPEIGGVQMVDRIPGWVWHR